MDATERRRRVSEEAAEWWMHLSGGEMSRAEREQFIDWLRESSLHVAEMLRVAQVNGALESFERWAHIVTERPSRERGVVSFPGTGSSEHDAQRISMLDLAAKINPSHGRVMRRPWFTSLAAGVCVLAIAALWLGGNLRGETITTGRGERREVTLPDGSVLQVGPETQLHVRFRTHERRIAFDYGVTLFKVAKDTSRPFFVEAERTVVRAVGTAFGVEQRGRGILITVAEGRVTVNDTPKWALPFSEAPPKLPEIALAAGQQVAVPRPGQVGSVRQVDSERALAWAAGRLVFENESVANAVAEFNRYNRLQMHVADDVLASRPISAVFDASDPESFIAFIESVASVRVVRSESHSITIASVQNDAADISQ